MVNIYPISRPDEVVTTPTHNPHTGKYDGQWIRTLVKVHYMINGRPHFIPPGFMSDLGTVPKPARMFVDRADESKLAFIFHDYGYGKDCPWKLTRKECDLGMRSIARYCNQDFIERELAYRTLRALGWSKYAKRNINYSPIDPKLLQTINEDNNYTV